jgi:cleavage and polyadenylation specificity factor subunit 3
MGRLKSALMSKYSERDEEIHIFTPRNTETVKLYFRGEKLAKVTLVRQDAIKSPYDRYLSMTCL